VAILRTVQRNLDSGDLYALAFDSNDPDAGVVAICGPLEGEAWRHQPIHHLDYHTEDLDWANDQPWGFPIYFREFR